MSVEYVVRCVDKPATLHVDFDDAIKTATHLALSNHCMVEIYEQKLVKTIRIESKIVTTEEDGTESQITV